MHKRAIQISASVMALMRGEVSVRGVAERFGVPEARVRQWRDVFEIAGTLALAEVAGPKRAGGYQPGCTSEEDGDPTTSKMPETTEIPSTPMTSTTTMMAPTTTTSEADPTTSEMPTTTVLPTTEAP